MAHLGQTEPGRPSDELLDPIPAPHQWLVTFYDGTTQTVSAHLMGSNANWVNLTTITGMHWSTFGEDWFQARDLEIVAKFRESHLRSVVKMDPA